MVEHTFPRQSAEDQLERWRRQLINRTLQIACCIAVLPLVLAVSEAIMTRHLWHIPIILLVFIVLVLSAVIPSIPYQGKSAVFIILLYSMGVYNLIVGANSGDAYMFLLAACLFSALLHGYRLGFTMVLLTTITIAIFAGLYLTHVLPPFHPDAVTLSSWLTRTSVYVLLNTLLILPQDALFQQLIAALQRSDALTHALQQEVHERSRAELELSEERACMATAIEMMPFPIMFVSHEHLVIRENQAARELSSSLGPSFWQQIVLLTPQTRRPLPDQASPIAYALNGERVSSEECLVQFPNGQEMPVLMHSAPIYGNHELAAAIIAFQDISALKEADRAKDQFLMVLSHELKTPLTSILGWTGAASDGLCPVARSLEIIARNTRDLQRIIDDLLDVSRLMYGRMPMRLEQVDFWLLAQMSIEKFSQMASERRVNFCCAPPVEPLQVLADPGRIRQAIDNLLDNALKFTPPGGTITIVGAQDARCALLTVQDTGRGINPDHIPLLFNPFQQIDRLEQAGGLGLGLALIRGIMESHQGTVSAHSEGIGHGCRFTLSLPLPVEYRQDPVLAGTVEPSEPAYAACPGKNCGK